MGRRGHKSFGKRRQILQLDEERREPAFGFGYKPHGEGSGGALSGLVSHYGQDAESEEDSDHDDFMYPSSRQLKKQTFLPAREVPQQSSRTPPPPAAPAAPAPPPPSVPAAPQPTPTVTNGNSKQPQVVDEIEDKVKDFLAELEGDDAENSLPPTPPQLEAAAASDTDDEEDEDEDDSGKPVEPPVPTTEWQHCLDDATQCYYYWNTASNEVQWTLPVEYSQYLLQQKEHERQLEKYQQELAAWHEQQSKKPEKKKKKKKDKKKKTGSLQITSAVEDEVVTPLVSYPPESPSSAEPPAATSGAAIFPAPLQSSVVMVAGSTDSVNDGVKMGADNSDMTVIDYGHKSSRKERKVFDYEHSKPEPPPDAIQHSGKPPKEKTRKSHKHRAAKDSLIMGPVEAAVPTVIGPSLPVEMMESKVSPEVTEVKKASTNKDNIDKADQSVTEDDTDLEEYIERKLEEPVFSHYEFQNKKYEGPQELPPELETVAEDSDVEDDLDDIDQQLELALQSKKVELQELEEAESSESLGAAGKRKSDEKTEEPITKRLKTVSCSSEESPSARKKKIHTDDIKHQVKVLTEIGDLASLTTDKLEFLDISRKGLSKLQILLIETETRIQDWKDGGLTAEFLLKKLKEAALQLEQYENSAAPGGWACHWDRENKRYFYSNAVTGQSQWDYPEEGGADQQGSQSQTATDEGITLGQSDDAAGTREGPVVPPPLPPAIPPPPPPPPPPQEDVAPLLEKPSETAAPPAASSTALLMMPPPPPPPSPPPPPPPSAPAPEEDSSMTATEPPPPGTGPPLPPQPFVEDENNIAEPPPGSPPQSDTIVNEPMDIEEDDKQEEHVGISENGSADPVSEDSGVKTEESSGRVAHISAAPVITKPTDTAVPLADEGSLPSVFMETTPTVPEVDTPGQSPPHSMAETVTQVASPAPQPTSQPTPKEKKKKKDKGLKAGSLTHKKKYPGLVQKWQKVQKEVEEEIAKEKAAIKKQDEEDDNL